MRITSIKQTGISEAADQREVVIHFADKQTIRIYGSYDAFVQYGYQGLTSEQTTAYAFTLPIAEHYTKWLNGGELPAPLQQVPVTEAEPRFNHRAFRPSEPGSEDEHWPTYGEQRNW